MDAETSIRVLQNAGRLWGLTIELGALSVPARVGRSRARGRSTPLTEPNRRVRLVLPVARKLNVALVPSFAAGGRHDCFGGKDQFPARNRYLGVVRLDPNLSE